MTGLPNKADERHSLTVILQSSLVSCSPNSKTQSSSFMAMECLDPTVPNIVSHGNLKMTKNGHKICRHQISPQKSLKQDGVQV